MIKPATLFLLMISFSLVFAGAVTAAPTVDVEVLDTDGNPVIEASPGDEVEVGVVTTADEYLDDPAVLVSTNPDAALQFKPEEAVMTYIYEDGTFDVSPNDPADPFFYWDDDFQAWVWWIGWAVEDNTMWPDEEAVLAVPATVLTTGEITVNADFMVWPEEDPEPTLVATDSYTFLSVDGPVVNGETVPMQDTGAPLAAAALGLLSIIGGTLYGRLR